MKKYIISLIFIFAITSCNNEFGKAHYRKRIIFDNRWERRRILYFNTGTYRNPIIYKDARQKLISPLKINLDKW
jgi:hypothetical protein